MRLFKFISSHRQFLNDDKFHGYFFVNNLEVFFLQLVHPLLLYSLKSMIGDNCVSFLCKVKVMSCNRNFWRFIEKKRVLMTNEIWNSIQNYSKGVQFLLRWGDESRNYYHCKLLSLRYMWDVVEWRRRRKLIYERFPFCMHVANRNCNSFSSFFLHHSWSINFHIFFLFSISPM